jgi:hypothetical protein
MLLNLKKSNNLINSSIIELINTRLLISSIIFEKNFLKYK